MRVRVAAALVVLLGASACGEQSAAPTTKPTEAQRPIAHSGFSPEQLERIQTIVEKLGPTSHITAATLRPATRDDGGGKPRRGTVWLDLRSPVGNRIERMEARWQADMVIAAFWRMSREAGDESLWGGSLRVSNPDPIMPTNQETAYVFNDPEAPTYLFSDAEGKPADLDVDRAAVEGTIRDEATKAGITIERLTFTGILGTAVEIVARTDHPEGVVERWHVFGSEGISLEGDMTVLKDSNGAIVCVVEHSLGLQSGSGGCDDGSGAGDGVAGG